MTDLLRSFEALNITIDECATEEFIGDYYSFMMIYYSY